MILSAELLGKHEAPPVKATVEEAVGRTLEGKTVEGKTVEGKTVGEIVEGKAQLERCQFCGESLEFYDNVAR